MKNLFIIFLITIATLFTLGCDESSSNNQSNYATISELDDLEVDINNGFNEKTRIIKGEYFGGPAYTAGTPFRFNINNLAPTIVDANVFVVASGYKTELSGDLNSPVQIEWNVTTIGADHVVELTVRDAEGILYEDPAVSPEWSNKKVKLKFHAYYVPAMPNASFME